jgi:hypothetical protein
LRGQDLNLRPSGYEPDIRDFAKVAGLTIFSVKDRSDNRTSLASDVTET